MEFVQVKVTITTPDGEILEQFRIHSLTEAHPRDTVLASRIRDHLEHTFDVDDEDDVVLPEDPWKEEG